MKTVMVIDKINIKSRLLHSDIEDLGNINNIETGSSTGKVRKDSRGIQILKGKKKHRLVYADKFSGKNLVEVIDVESFKEFNAMEPPDEEVPEDNNVLYKGVNKPDDVSSCKCNIL